MSALRGGRLDRSGFTLAFDEGFDGVELDRSRWLPWYLPQWSARERTAARYAIADGMLRLRIDEDTPEWSPEFDPGVRVGNLQTGVRSGSLGSADGQHHFRSGLVVREAQTASCLYTPHYGLWRCAWRRARIRAA